ncbi:MAG: hypothetical protein JRC90_11150 [Deltaproteobacteria bacterium]|nr:hypothetical protein [Deltaproteobacteria bacterium]
MVEDSEGWALKEGYFGGINFVDAGVVFFQVVTRDFREVLYDEFSSLDDGEYHEKNYLGEDGHGEGDDLLEILDTHPLRLYHLRYNIKPRKGVRVYLYWETTPIGGLDKKTTITKKDWGFLTGEKIDANPEKAEILFPYKTTINFEIYNKSGRTVTPQLELSIWRYNVKFITDEKLIEKLKRAEIRRRIFPFGGIEGVSWATTPEDAWGVSPVSLEL